MEEGNSVIVNEFNSDDYAAIELNNKIHPRIQLCPMYFNLGFSPIPNIYARSIVLKNLLKALDFLPTEYGLMIWDVYRPRFVQRKLFNWMSEQIRINHPELSEEDNLRETQKYMSLPSEIGDSYCPPHLSGGAVDLTLFDIASGKELEMGTVFDDCTERAHSDFFTIKNNLSPEEEIIQNRRKLLHRAMNSVGFTSYQYEWWHFDIGNIFWSRIVKQPAVFGPLFNDEELPLFS